MKNVHSKQEGNPIWQEWTRDRLPCENALQDESQTADALKELLLQKLFRTCIRIYIQENVSTLKTFHTYCQQAKVQ